MLTRLPVKQPQRGERTCPHRDGKEALQAPHPCARVWASLVRSAGMKATSTNGNASPSPKRGENQDRSGQRKEQRRAERGSKERSAQGVATKAASAPVPKLPAGRGGTAKHWQLEQAEKVGSDRDGQQQQEHDRARVLQLERPARLGPAARIASRIAPSAPVPTIVPAEYASASERASRPPAGAGDMQGFQRKDREDARHQVEEYSARDRAEHGPDHRFPAELSRGVPSGTGPGAAAEFETAAVSERDHRREIAGGAAPLR